MGEAVNIGILGAGGRMGQALLVAIAHDQRFHLAGAVERPGHPSCGQPLPGGQVICGNALPLARAAQVLLDFTTPDALDENLRAAVEGRAAIVVGTTGLNPHHHAAIDRAAQHTAVLQSPTMSLGVAVLARTLEHAVRALPDWDIEVLEMHHRHKLDAPSGTALYLAEAAARGRAKPLHELRATPAPGQPRRPGAIGFASLRGGSVAGDHQVILAHDGERLEFTHRAESREMFARGALHAAQWLAAKPPGRYTLADALT